jgi:hypothetical protein
MLTIGRLPHKFQAAAQDNNATQGKTTTTRPPGGPPTPALCSQVVLSDGPASYWKLNETKLNETSGTTATDRTGANNGTYTIGPTLGQTGSVSSTPRETSSGCDRGISAQPPNRNP